MVKVLKRLIGTVYIDGKSHPVYSECWEKTTKDGNTYYEERIPVFVNKVEQKPKEEQKQKLEA